MVISICLGFAPAITVNRPLFLQLMMLKDIGAFVVALSSGLPPQTILTAYSEYLSLNEICELIKKVTGANVVYKQFSAADLETIFPHTLQLFADQWTFIAKYRYFPRENVDRNEHARNYNIEVSVRTSFKQWLEGNDELPTLLRLDGGQQKDSNTTGVTVRKIGGRYSLLYLIPIVHRIASLKITITSTNSLRS